MYRSKKNMAMKRASLSAVVAAGALASGVGIAGIAGASTHSPRTSLATGTVPLASPLGGSVGDGPDMSRGIGAVGDGGIVTGVTASSVSVIDKAGTTRTFNFAGSTKFTKNRTAATSSDLVVGEMVRITPSSTSATKAAGIQIDLAHAGGKVVSVSSNSIVVTGRGGANLTIDVSGATTFTKAGTSSTLSSVSVGSFIFAQGLSNASHTVLNASVVGIAQPIVGTMPGAPLGGRLGPKGTGGPMGGGGGGAW